MDDPFAENDPFAIVDPFESFGSTNISNHDISFGESDFKSNYSSDEEISSDENSTLIK